MHINRLSLLFSKRNHKSSEAQNIFSAFEDASSIICVIFKELYEQNSNVSNGNN